MQLLLATHNAHKIEEIRRLLVDSGLQLLSLSDVSDVDDLPETGTTFEANALQKAREAFRLTGIPCVADDSGIEVDALDGAPGVFSKRFSPEATAAANNALLLERLSGHTDRTARFRCVLAVVADGFERVVEGRCEGIIGTQLEGAGGFGYDPLFWPDETPGRTMAQLSMDEKNAISHRGRAFSQLPGLVTELTRPGR